MLLPDKAIIPAGWTGLRKYRTLRRDKIGFDCVKTTPPTPENTKITSARKIRNSSSENNIRIIREGLSNKNSSKLNEMAAADIRTGSYAVIRDFQRAGARSGGIFHGTNK